MLVRLFCFVFFFEMQERDDVLKVNFATEEHFCCPPKISEIWE